MKNHRLIVLNTNNTDIDYQPAATIMQGDEFEERLKNLFEEHYDCEIKSVETSPHIRIPNSFNCKITTEDSGTEDFILLRAWDY